MALSLNPESLERVEALDPDAVLMEVTDFYGSCWEIVRALWLHPRLKYAPVLLATPEGVASYAQGTPDVPSLCLAVQTVSEAYERIERSAENDDAFEVELAHLGPAKLLRVLTESSRGFRVSLKCPVADFEVDVAEGIIVGAQGNARGAANDLYLGVHALALLMTQERGRGSNTGGRSSRRHQRDGPSRCGPACRTRSEGGSSPGRGSDAGSGVTDVDAQRCSREARPCSERPR